MATTRNTSYTKTYMKLEWDNKLQPAIDRRQSGKHLVCKERDVNQCRYAPMSSEDLLRLSAKNRHLYEVAIYASSRANGTSTSRSMTAPQRKPQPYPRNSKYRH